MVELMTPTVELMILLLEAKCHQVLLKLCHTEVGLCLTYGSSQAHVVCIPMFICMIIRWLIGKESTGQCRRRGFDPSMGKIPCKQKWQPTPVFLPGKSHGQRSLVGYSLWGCRVRYNWATGHTYTHTHTHTIYIYTHICRSHMQRNIVYYKDPATEGRQMNDHETFLNHILT